MLGAIANHTLVDDCIGCSLVGVLYTTIGAGIGVGIDAVIVRERIIFAHMQRSSVNIVVTPLLTADHKGLSLSWSF